MIIDSVKQATRGLKTNCKISKFEINICNLKLHICLGLRLVLNIHAGNLAVA
jgi:hypothetical protein